MDLINILVLFVSGLIGLGIFVGLTKFLQSGKSISDFLPKAESKPEGSIAILPTFERHKPVQPFITPPPPQCKTIPTSEQMDTVENEQSLDEYVDTVVAGIEQDNSLLDTINEAIHIESLTYVSSEEKVVDDKTALNEEIPNSSSEDTRE